MKTKNRKNIFIGGILLMVLLAFLFSACGETQNHSQELVLITSYLGVEDKNGNFVGYGTPKSQLLEELDTDALLNSWEVAHENLSLRLASWPEFEDPTVQQLHLIGTADQPQPSWTVPNGAGIGQSKEEIAQAYHVSTEQINNDILDLLYCQDTEQPDSMYPITEQELEELIHEDNPPIIFRVVVTFEEEKANSIQMGTLDSMG